MKRTARVYIDFQKLDEQIAAIGFKKCKVARGMGYSDSLFSNAKDRGFIHADVAERLDLVYGIKRKTYEIAEPKKPEPITTPIATVAKAEEQKPGIDYVRLYNTIYQAVLTALQENAKGLHDHLFEVR